MDKQAITEKIKTHLSNGKIGCEDALKISQEEGISFKDMGVLLNELEIKVSNCQLGCFP